MPICSSLLGAHEVAALLGLTRQGLDGRRRQPDFPAPVAELRATPVWTRDDLIEYACSRSARLEERAAIARLAEEAEEVVLRGEAGTGDARRRRGRDSGRARAFTGPTMSSYAARDAVAFARASIERDDELMDEILKRYSLRGDELLLVCTLAALVGFARDGAEDMADELFELQLAGAAR